MTCQSNKAKTQCCVLLSLSFLASEVHAEKDFVGFLTRLKIRVLSKAIIIMNMQMVRKKRK